jgi:hypothetical protein
MAANTNPIFSRAGDIQGGVLLNAAAADYTGQNINNLCVFVADPVEGGFLQRLRFKPAGGAANSDAKVARIYINDGLSNLASAAATPGAPATPTPTGSGSTLIAGTYYAKVQAIDAYGSPTALSTAETSVTITAGQNIPWTWTAVAGAASYRLWVGNTAGGQQAYFNTSTASFTQSVPYVLGQLNSPADYVSNNFLYGEVSLPTTALSTTAATVEIDYPMNIALSPGRRVFVGLGAFTQGGWYCTAIGGKY